MTKLSDRPTVDPATPAPFGGGLHISGVEYEHPVGKRIELASDGTTIKTALLGERARPGKLINRHFETAREAFSFRASAPASIMMLAGTFDPVIHDAMVVPNATLEKAFTEFEPDSRPALVSPTGLYLEFREEPGLISIDIDFKTADEVSALWPADPSRLMTPDAVLKALYSVLPEARGCPAMVMPSSSSMLANATTGEVVLGPGGWRCLIASTDASQTPRVLQVIHQRCWATGIHRYAFVSRGGQILHRSLADLALGRPTQPDYPVADLGPGLVRAAGATLTCNLDGSYFDPSTVLLSDDDGRLAREQMRHAGDALRPNAEAVAAHRQGEIAQKLISRGVAPEAARRASEARSSSMLLGSDLVEFEDGPAVAVAKLLSPEGEQFDRRRCFDPVEPDYDGARPVGQFYWNRGRSSRIHSFAHGSRTYRLCHDSASAREAITGAGLTPDAMGWVLANASVTSIEFDQLVKTGAKALGLGNKTSSLRELVTKNRQQILAARPKSASGGFDEDHSVALSSPLPTAFPVTFEDKVLDHPDNIRHLLNGYGIDYRYNVITKDFEWDHPEVKQAGDNAGEQLVSTLVGLCSLNGVPKQNLVTHLTALGNVQTANPVLEHLSSLKWDGVPRIEKLADAMDASDSVVARIALRTFFLQACAAADHAASVSHSQPRYRPCFECVLVLVGAQGIGKTKGLRKLLPPVLRKYFKEGLVLDVRNKDSVKAGSSTWVCELGEMDSTFRKNDIAQLKAFLSLPVDELRTPYAQRPSMFERRTVFVASVNELEFLADETGNRRFFPIMATRVDVGWSDEELEQVWAEALARYLGGEQWWPTSDEETLLAANAEKYRARSAVEDRLSTEFDWTAGPNLKSRRCTAAEIYQLLYPGPRPDMATLKTIGTSVRRLYRESGHAQVRQGALWTKDAGDGWVRLLADSGENRGWLLPPRRSSAGSRAVSSLFGLREHLPTDVSSAR